MCCKGSVLGIESGDCMKRIQSRVGFDAGYDLNLDALRLSRRYLEWLRSFRQALPTIDTVHPNLSSNRFTTVVL